MMTLGLIALLALAGGVMVLLRRPAPPARQPDDRDQAELDRAERDVRDLGTSVSPEDADDELTDWGPGTPK